MAGNYLELWEVTKLAREEVYARGLSHQDVADHYGVSRQLISMALNERTGGLYLKWALRILGDFSEWEVSGPFYGVVKPGRLYEQPFGGDLRLGRFEEEMIDEMRERVKVEVPKYEYVSLSEGELE